VDADSPQVTTEEVGFSLIAIRELLLILQPPTGRLCFDVQHLTHSCDR